MANQPAPWKSNRPQGPNNRVRWIVWLALLVGGGIGLWALAQAYPQNIGDSDGAYIIQYVALAALLSASLVFSRQFSLGEFARNIAIWVGVVAVAVLVYTFQDDLLNVWNRVAGEFSVEPTITGPREMTINATDDGDFATYGEVNGVRIRFTVDTGASSIVLSPGDAQRLGIDLAQLNFNRASETANGVGYDAAYTLPELKVGGVTLTNVPVEINKAGMQTSLLGMTFLRRMKSFNFQGRKLVIRW
jgi:aspartyl protease family protein